MHLWHPTKNGDLKPTDVSGKAGVEVWWQCDRGHEWQRRVIDTARGRRCPWCFGQKLIPERSFAARFPEVAAEWHPTKNGDLLPTDVTPMSPKRVWWLCSKGHEWDAVVGNRARGHGCGVCANRRVTEANALSTTHPELAAEWHPTKNAPLTPDDVSSGSMEKPWWKCAQGHEWRAQIHSRARKGYGCKSCSNRVAHDGYNLTLTHPELAAEWHPKNSLGAVDVLPGSSRKVWWRCADGHEWEAVIGNRTRGHGCPFCSGSKATPETSLAALNPEAAALWHPTKNGTRTPDQIRPAAAGKAWWLCPKGHEWNAFITSINRGSQCPYCIGFKASAENNLRVLAPRIAAQWHPTRNADNPEEYVPGSTRKKWWMCAFGHEWEAPIYHRTRGFGCTGCASLAAKEPEVAAQWHPTKNGKHTPETVKAGSSRKAWWVCPVNSDHVWRTQVNTRVKLWKRRKGGCPGCATTAFKPDQPAWFYILEGPHWGKLGITNDLERRLRQHAQHGTFGTLVGSWHFTEGQHARDLEDELLEIISEAPTAPSDIPGYTESFPAVMTTMLLEQAERLSPIPSE